MCAGIGLEKTFRAKEVAKVVRMLWSRGFQGVSRLLSDSMDNGHLTCSHVKSMLTRYCGSDEASH